MAADKQTVAAASVDTVTKSKPHRHKASWAIAAFALLLAIAASIGGWYFYNQTNSDTAVPKPQAPPAATVQTDTIMQQTAMLHQQLRRLFLLEIRHYLILSEQQIRMGGTDSANLSLRLAAKRIAAAANGVERETQAHLEQLLKDDLRQLQIYSNRHAQQQALRLIDLLLVRHTSTPATAHELQSEPAAALSFWQQPLEFIQARLGKSLTLETDKHHANTTELDAQTLLAQSLVLIRTAITSREETFYRLAVENALTLQQTLNNADEETYQILTQLAELKINAQPPTSAALRYLEKLLENDMESPIQYPH